ncbi:MAG: hypothetical protein FJY97_17485 [candidate division Zixibacteria bacterium]|nr:hypothetical protein [candidate division Zixibacteria bacterium]
MRNLLSLLFADAVITTLACGSNGPTGSNLLGGSGASPDLSSPTAAFPAITPAGVTVPKQLATKATIQSSATGPGSNVLILVDTQNAGTTALVNRLTS